MPDINPLAHEFARERKWTTTEKAVARHAYDLALKREFETILPEAKERAARATNVSELWELEEWLRERRRHIGNTFDYRYSVLVTVFARLIYADRLTIEELKGLSADKLEEIQQILRIRE